MSAAPPADRRPQASAAPDTVRRRRRPGERRTQILQALAAMLQAPDGDRVTTAALAARIGVSQAALYRHFASKAQMYEGLIEFIEDSVARLIAPVAGDGAAGTVQAGRIVAALLHFGERNPGMTRVLTGDALVHEHARLGERVNLFFDGIEARLRRCLDGAPAADGTALPGGADGAAARASVLTAFCIGRLQRHARSGFRRPPTEHLDAALRLLLAAGPADAPDAPAS